MGPNVPRGGLPSQGGTRPRSFKTVKKSFRLRNTAGGRPFGGGAVVFGGVLNTHLREKSAKEVVLKKKGGGCTAAVARKKGGGSRGKFFATVE